MINLESHSKRFPKQMQKFDPLKKTCSLCGRRHNDKGYNKVCRHCWLSLTR